MLESLLEDQLFELTYAVLVHEGCRKDQTMKLKPISYSVRQN